MAKAKKDGKAKRNKENLSKRIKMINRNQELIKQLKENL
jgi:hypothetical protein